MDNVKMSNAFKITLIWLPVVLCLSCQNKEIPGLVAEYSMNGNAMDISGNGNHGVVHGAFLTMDRFGNENCAYRFDGTASNILAFVSNMPAVNEAQTISWWFKADQQPVFSDQLGAGNMIALVDTTDGIGLQFGYRAPGYHSLGLDGWYWGGRTILETEPPIVDEWHHCVYTYDGKMHCFYVDGRQTAQSSVQPQTGNPNMLMFGNYPGGDQYFSGCLDEVCVYHRALSAAEIDLLYNEKESSL